MTVEPVDRIEHYVPDPSGFEAVLHALSRTGYEREALQRIAEEALSVSGADIAAIAYRIPERGVLVFSVVHGVERSSVIGMQIDEHLTGVADCFSAGRAILRRASAHPLLGSLSSTAIAPIIVDGEPIAALFCVARSESPPIDVSVLPVLDRYALYASVAYRLLTTRQQAEERARELEAILATGGRLLTSLSVPHLLESALTAVSRAMDLQTAAVFLLSEDRSQLFAAAAQGFSETDRSLHLDAERGWLAHVWNSAEAIVRSDPSFEDEAAQFSFADRVRSLVLIPIRHHQTPLGVMMVTSAVPSAFSELEVTLLGYIGTQTGAALGNAMAYERESSRAEEAAALYELTRNLNGAAEEAEVLKLACRTAMELLRADTTGIWAFHPSELRLMPDCLWGAEIETLSLHRPRLGQGILGWSYEWQTPVGVPVVENDPRNRSCRLENVHSLLCVPLSAGADNLGVLSVFSARWRLFTVEETELLYTIANLSAIAVERLRLFADTRKRSSETRRYFRRVAKALGEVLASDGMTRSLIEIAAEMLQMDRAAVYRRDAAGLTLIECCGFRTTVLPEQSAPLLEGLPGWVARRGKPLTIFSLSADPRTASHPWIARDRMESFLAVPLRHGGEIVGVLELFSADPKKFVSEDIRMLSEFCRRSRLGERLLEQSQRPTPQHNGPSGHPASPAAAHP